MLKTLFQKVIYQMKDAIDGVIGIIDEKGIIISCNQLIKIGESLPKILDATHDLVIAEGFTYRSINPDYVVFVEGEDKTAEDLSMLLAIVSNNIFYLYNENYDKSTFIKNIILDNIPQSNIFIKAKDLCVKTDAMRIVLLIKIENNSSLLNELKYLFYENDYIFTINEQDIVFVYEIKQKNYDKEIEKIVKQIIDTILSKQDKKVRIGVGGIIYDLNNIVRSFQEAQTALEVGKIFDPENNVVYYEKLNIGRLIYQLPETLCEMYLEEILKDNSIDLLEPEIINTINCLFENNFNGLEASKKLSIHRNTLVYRLEKVRKITGLDLNNFNQAVTFKFAFMINKYLDNR